MGPSSPWRAQTFTLAKWPILAAAAIEEAGGVSAEGGLKDKREGGGYNEPWVSKEAHTRLGKKTSTKSNGFLLVATSMHRF